MRKNSFGEIDCEIPSGFEEGLGEIPRIASLGILFNPFRIIKKQTIQIHLA